VEGFVVFGFESEFVGEAADGRRAVVDGLEAFENAILVA
jgi:hypothetical protein